MRVLKLTFKNETLNQTTFDKVLLRYLLKEMAIYIPNEIHVKGRCAHYAGPTLADQIKRLGHYFLTMLQDTIRFVKASPACQMHIEYIINHLTTLPEHIVFGFPIYVSQMLWYLLSHPSLWHVFILIAIDYFS